MTYTFVLIFICIYNHTLKPFIVNLYARYPVAWKHTNKSFNTSIKQKLEHIIYYPMYILAYIFHIFRYIHLNINTCLLRKYPANIIKLSQYDLKAITKSFKLIIKFLFLENLCQPRSWGYQT